MCTGLFYVVNVVITVFVRNGRENLLTSFPYIYRYTLRLQKSTTPRGRNFVVVFLTVHTVITLTEQLQPRCILSFCCKLLHCLFVRVEILVYIVHVPFPSVFSRWYTVNNSNTGRLVSSRSVGSLPPVTTRNAEMGELLCC